MMWAVVAKVISTSIRSSLPAHSTLPSAMRASRCFGENPNGARGGRAWGPRPGRSRTASAYSARFCWANRRCHDLTHTLCRSTACGVLWASSREETGLHVFVTAAVGAAETALAGALSYNEV